jgi:hypothetical protein
MLSRDGMFLRSTNTRLKRNYQGLVYFVPVSVNLEFNGLYSKAKISECLHETDRSMVSTTCIFRMFTNVISAQLSKIYLYLLSSLRGSWKPAVNKICNPTKMLGVVEDANNVLVKYSAIPCFI